MKIRVIRFVLYFTLLTVVSCSGSKNVVTSETEDSNSKVSVEESKSEKSSTKAAAEEDEEKPKSTKPRIEAEPVKNEKRSTLINHTPK